MKALVLGGGSIKGGWQTGAIQAVLESGFEPDVVTGISVGAFNGLYLVHEHMDTDWKETGIKLWDFWRENIQVPEDIALKRGFLRIAWEIVTKKFNGLTDTRPIIELMDNTIDFNRLVHAGVKFFVGAINVNDGTIVYANPSYPNFREYVIGSSVIPFAMPVTKIGTQSFVDGGLRDSAPIGIAIEKGATEIVVIACNPKVLGGVEINTEDPMQMSERVTEIISNNTLNEDIKMVRLINGLCDGKTVPGGQFKGKKRIKMTVIRPDVPINVNLNHFNTKDISMMLYAGYAKAKEILSK